VEVLFGGSDAGPDEKQVQSYRRFAEHLDANIARLRKQIFFGFLWQPIRIAINMENLVGVQFRNRLTGNQGKLILDELPREELRAVAGAAVMSHEGKVIYNLLTPHMLEEATDQMNMVGIDLSAPQLPRERQDLHFGTGRERRLKSSPYPMSDVANLHRVLLTGRLDYGDLQLPS